MKWKYRNDTDEALIWNDRIWEPGDERDVSFPIPADAGLTCIQDGDVPDPVLFHDDILLQPGETKQIDLSGQKHTKQVALSIYNMAEAGVECRFMAETNRPIPLDVRGFVHTVPWEMCGRLFFKNVGDGEAHISLSAVEVTQ